MPRLTALRTTSLRASFAWRSLPLRTSVRKSKKQSAPGPELQNSGDQLCPEDRAAIILKQLFPEYVAREAKASERRNVEKDIEIPRMPLPIIPEADSTPVKRAEHPKHDRKAEQKPMKNEDRIDIRKTRHAARAIEFYTGQGKERPRDKPPSTAYGPQSAHSPPDGAVLVLQAAEKHLMESDFRRLIPRRGKHISQWQSDEDDIVRVIPGRDPNTLEALGYYFILFKTASGARAYLERAHTLHKLVKQYTPENLHSVMVPPPGYIIDGEDVYEVIQMFSLVGASQNLALRILHAPYSPVIRKLFEEGGDGRIVESQVKNETLVSFHVEGLRLREEDIRRAIFEDGQDRQLGWGLAEYNAVLGINSPSSEERPRSGGRERQEQKLQRWTIAFRHQAEAMRFVRAWHLMPYPPGRKPIVEEETTPLMHVEYLW